MFSLGGKPLLELLTPEPIYAASNSILVTVNALVVNSFGKTVRAEESLLAVTVVNGTERTNSGILGYIVQTGQLVALLPEGLQIEFDNEDRYIEILLTSAANFTTTISISPIYAGKPLLKF